MALGLCGIRTACEFAQTGIFRNLESVLDLGSQEIHATKNDFLKIVKSYGYSPDLKNFPNIDNWPKDHLNSESLKSFWRLLGFQKIDQTDINSRYGAKYLDLNEPLKDETLIDSYDLVTDFGNNEHPFNSAEAFKTMHKICKKHGLLWTHQKLYGGNGFYNYDVSFFECMAAANNYEILSAFLTIWTENDQDQLRIPLSISLLNCLDLNKLESIGISYLFRKTSNDDFKVPLQFSITENNDWKNGRTLYKPSFLPELTHLGVSPKRAYIPGSISKRQALKIVCDSLLTKKFSNLLFKNLNF